MQSAKRPDGESPGETLERLIDDEMEALSDLKALLTILPGLRPSALALQVATCNRRRLRTITELEQYTGYSLARVTPASLRHAGTDPQSEAEASS